MAPSVSSGLLLPLRPILEWLPQETLFSLCSRYHRISGHRIPAQTCSTLFGNARSGSAHDVPSRVQTLVDRTDGALGTARDILLEHTLLPFYFPFHSTRQCENWLIQIAAGSTPALKAQLGLAASQFGASHPLKACPDCMQLDTRDYGVSYWHVDHQVPGVHTCPTHQTPLLIATDKVSGQDRFGWVLPQQANLHNPLANLLSKSEVDLFTEGALALWRLPITFTFSLDKLHKLYYNEFVRCGFALKSSSKDEQKHFDQVLRDIVAVNSLTAFWPWLASPDCQRNLSARLRRVCHPTSPRVSRHPMTHLFLITLLFSSWEHFWTTYNNEESNYHNTEVFGSQNAESTIQEACESSHQLKISLIEELRSGKSISLAAKIAGITVATAITWAASEGIASPHRPKILNPDMRSRLVRQLQRGADKASVASTAKISVASVTRLLLSEPGLHSQWCAARFSKAQQRSRNTWKRITEAFPTASSNEWRKLDPAVYAWLYRNDRAWLQSSILNRPQTSIMSAQRRDWKSRDTALAQVVQVAALEWQLSHPGKRLTIGIICAEVDGLRRKMSAIAKLPLTRMAIQTACANTSRSVD